MASFMHKVRGAGRSIAILCALAFLFVASVANAQAPKLAPEAVTWSLAADFEKDKAARMNLSGAACVPTTPKFSSCLTANDDKTYAQFFSISNNTLTPKKVILLSDADDDPDAEAVAYADGYFYVTGSHGRSRANKQKKTSYAVFRFPVDPRNGQPTFVVTDDRVVGVEVSTRLREALRNGKVIEDYYNEPLADNGINIEGIAAANGRLHFGLRAPSVDDHAFIVSVRANALFSKTRDLKTKVTTLALGKDTGIRDLAAVKDGFLILAGSAQDQAIPASVWFWDGKADKAKALATLDLDGIDPKGKAETLLPLDESPSGFRVLVMFDGIENGGPRSFKLPR